MNTKKHGRERLFEIITIGSKADFVSRAFDMFLSVTIIINIIVTILLTFDTFSSFFGFFTVIEIVTLSLFAVEYILRIITADYLYPESKPFRAILKFLFSFDGIVDLLTVLPLVAFSGFIAFRILRVVRIFHLFRINSSLDSFNVIALVIKEKRKQIASSVLIIFIFMLASSLGIYSVEHQAQPDAFKNAFSGIWWSVSALLTVGYGDIYPITVLGKIMGILVAFLGVGLVAIPTGIISAGFVEQYSLKAQSVSRLTDINEIGEIKLSSGHDAIGKTVAFLSKGSGARILLVIRNGLQLIPSQTLVLAENDIIIVESSEISKQN